MTAAHVAYREFAPAAALASHVACTWTRVVESARVELVIPDACADVILVGGAAHVAGPADHASRVALSAGSVVHGLRLRPGAAGDLLRTEMSELRNVHVGLAAVTRGLDVDERDPRASLERWAAARLARARGDGAAVHAVRVLVTSASVDQAARALGWGARRLHRHVTASCGYGPKTLQRILRLQRALRLAFDAARDAAHGAPRGAGRARGLAELAAAAGYADQAHMTRDFTELTGLPPARYLAVADPEVGRWLVSDPFKTASPRGGIFAA